MIGRVLVGWSVVALVGGSPVGAAVTGSSASGFRVENIEIVAATPDTAWRVFVEEVDLWWPKDHTWWGAESTLSIDPVAGGCFCERVGARQAEHMRVAFVDPPRLLRMVGGLGPLQGMGLHGALEWGFEPEGEGTRLSLVYQVGGYATSDLAAFAPIVDQVQALQLGGLADRLRGEVTAVQDDATPGSVARGTFDVTLEPVAAAAGSDPAGPGRMIIDKRYHGDLEGRAGGEMLTAMTAVEGSAGYVAIERVEGTLDGRSGSFVLQHSGLMDRGSPRLEVAVVPDSGTGQLAGLAGTLAIEIAEGEHRYELRYTLPDAP